MKMKHMLVFYMSLMLALILSQAVYASELGVKVIGQKEDMVHTPVVRDGTTLFPIREILHFLDGSGTETVVTHDTPVHSYISYQGQCYNITNGKTDVQEYEVDETGTCITPTGKVYQLEKPASYLDDYSLGIYVPLSFVSDITAISKYGSKYDSQYIEKDYTLEFSKYTLDTAGEKQSVLTPITLAMKINSPWLLTELLTGDGGDNFDDNDHSITPIIQNGNTLLPIAPIIEKMKGKVNWNENDRKVTITLDKDTIELWIDKKTALVNGAKKEMDVAPSIYKGKTMIPVRFVSENLGAKVLWDGDSQMILIYYGGAQGNETDFFKYGYKISLLDAVQKKEDNQQTLADVVKEAQQEHDKIQYNNTDPFDYSGKLIHDGDTVGLGTFSGTVKEIRGTKVLVYWDHASFIVEKGKENETAMLFGINWLADQWVDAKTVTIESSGY